MQPYAVQIESLIIQQLSDAMSVLDREGDGISRILDLKSVSYTHLTLPTILLV